MPDTATAATRDDASRTPVVPSAYRRMRTAIFFEAFAVLAVVCAAILFADLNEVIGRRAFVLGVLFAFAPVIPLVAIFVWLDRLRPEPTRLLVTALVWGACIATLVSLRLNGWLSDQIGDQFGLSPRSAIFIAPWVEETTKAAIIFAIVWWRRNDFNSVIAGVVYGGLAGTGFAFTENIVYYGQIFQRVANTQRDNSLALDAVQQLFWWRGVAAPFVHPMFTMMTGLGIGLAVRYRHVGVRILAPVAGFCAAALLHMGYNIIASFAVNKALSAVYVGILIPTLVVLAILVALVRRHELSVIAARLHDYSAFGWLAREHIPFIVTSRGRRRSRRYARSFGKAEEAKLRAFQRHGVNLGVLRDRLVRGVAGESEIVREARLITALREARGSLILPGIAMSDEGSGSVTRSSW